MLHNMLKHRLH